MDCFSKDCDNFGLIINTKKTKVMYQPAHGKPFQETHITVKGQQLQAVDNFTYLVHPLSCHQHWCWDQQQGCQSQRHLWEAPRECVGAERYQHTHQAEGLPCSFTHNTALCLWDLDRLQQTRQTAQPLSHKLPPSIDSSTSSGRTKFKIQRS